MLKEFLSCTVDGSTAEIKLARPKQYNSFNAGLRRELVDTIKELEDRDEVRLIILRGSGPGFTAGADLNEPFPPPISEHLECEYRPIFEAINNSKLLIIAAVHGSAAGIGAALAMTCDFLIMSESARISVIFSNIGLVPDGGSTWFLHQALGYRKALQLVVEGGYLSAADCLQYGIANKVVKDSELEVESKKWADALSKRAPLANEAAKRLLRAVSNKSYGEAFESEALEQDKLSVSEDFHNARIAFLKKVKPKFMGR